MPHCVLVPLLKIGTGNGVDAKGNFSPDCYTWDLPDDIERESGVNHARELGLKDNAPGVPTAERADIPESHDIEQGYFAIWVWFPEARLDELVTDGTILKVIYRDKDPIPGEKFTIKEIADAAAGVLGAKKVPGVVAKDVEKQKVQTEVTKLPPREGKG